MLFGFRSASDEDVARELDFHLEMHIEDNIRNGMSPDLARRQALVKLLPLKLLIREDAHGKVWVTYNSPEYLRRRYDLPQNVLQNIAGVEALARKAGG